MCNQILSLYLPMFELCVFGLDTSSAQDDIVLLHQRDIFVPKNIIAKFYAKCLFAVSIRFHQELKTQSLWEEQQQDSKLTIC